MSLFPPPEDVSSEVWTELPSAFRTPRRSEWADVNHGGRHLHSFLEGPAFDRDGNLYVVDVAHGRIFRISTQGAWSLVAEYDGRPNGLAIHKDGRIFIADYARGILVLEPDSGRIEPVCTHHRLEPFRGVNDLTFSSAGELYFTDQGQSGLHDPSGGVFRLGADGSLTKLMGGIPSPNGLALSEDESFLFVAVTRANAIWRLPLLADGGVSKVGNFIQLSGGTGPDGLAPAADEALAVCHNGLGSVWIFNRLGEPLYRIRSCRGLRTTNAAFGAADGAVAGAGGGPGGRSRLYITESDTGTILVAECPLAGRPLFSHS